MSISLPDKFKKPFNFVVGCLVIFLAFRLFVGSSLFSQSLPTEGRLAVGSPAGDLFQSVLESAFAIISGLGAFTVLRLSGLISILYSQLSPLFTNTDSNSNSNTTPLVNSISETSRQFHSQFATPVQTASTIPVGMMEDLSRLLVQSAIDKDARLTVVIAEKMAGETYLTPYIVGILPSGHLKPKPETNPGEI
jgi:hypothetical protein